MILWQYRGKYIPQTERKRLQKIVEAIKPKNFGVIVRTAAEGKILLNYMKTLPTW